MSVVSAKLNPITAKLIAGQKLSAAEFKALLLAENPELADYLSAKARARCAEVYGRVVFFRGLIEFTNFCRNDCYYCGIRRSNQNCERYRLTKDEILECCSQGYALGFRTFVLQGGEDAYFTDERLCDIIESIKNAHPDCAVTLSVGERSYDSYQKLKKAGADRYLLRHETADSKHYNSLHPPELSLAHRLDCLNNLKKLGFQTGCGMMIGSPGQTVDTLVEDLMLLQDFRPQMVGMGPFIPHHDTPFGAMPSGSVEKTLFILSVVRLMLPEVLLPATTALGTAAADGRERGIMAGANVVMPNLSPRSVRDKYMLYDNKINTNSEAAEGLAELKNRLQNIGYELVIDRGDWHSNK
jgi:biotin synthase